MAQKDFDAFTAELMNFAGLWKSGTLSCVAVGRQGVFINLGTRIILEPEVQGQREVLRLYDLQDTDPPLFGISVRDSLAEINQVMYQLVATGKFQVEIKDFLCWVEASGTAAGRPGITAATYPWLPPSQRTRSVAREDWSLDRPLRVLIQSGVSLVGAFSPEKLDKLNGRLKSYKQGPVAGVVGLIRELMPGAPTDPMQGFAQVVAPLPFDLSYTPDSRLTVVAPEAAFENGIVVSTFYKPRGAERHELSVANSHPTFEGYLRRWEGTPEWPERAEAASVELLYNDVGVDTLTNITPPVHTPRVTVAGVSDKRTSDGGSVGTRSDSAPPGMTEVALASSLERRYRIVKKLGAGGMGSVFLAEQINLGNRPVALKVLSRNLLDDPEFLERFHNEGASTARIRHSNVVTIYDSGQTDDGSPYIAMEYLEGQPLRLALRGRGALPVAECAEILQQAARGLNAAHNLGIIHRDVKPDNLFLTRGDEGELVVKVVDFGIAKLREFSIHTKTGVLLGTPAYMSYEQASGMKSNDLDIRSDIYSLGVVVYEMLMGRLPFESDTPLGYLGKHLHQNPPPFRDANPDIPPLPGAERVVMKALTKDRDRRYASVLDFAREFIGAASGRLQPEELRPTVKVAELPATLVAGQTGLPSEQSRARLGQVKERGISSPPDQYSEEETKLLFAAAERGEFFIHSSEQLGKWVMVGATHFVNENDPAFAVTYLDAFRSLVAKGLVRHYGGNLHMLTDRGFKVARDLNASIGDGKA